MISAILSVIFFLIFGKDGCIWCFKAFTFVGGNYFAEYEKHHAEVMYARYNQYTMAPIVGMVDPDNNNVQSKK